MGDEYKRKVRIICECNYIGNECRILLRWLVMKLARMLMLCLLGAQMERLQYLGLKRIAFGLLDTSTVSRLDVVVTRLDLIVVTSAFILTLVSDL